METKKNKETCSITQSQFNAELIKRTTQTTIKTGFDNLDAMQPLYPGLYCIGGNPGSGKTTFCLQMADQIAASGTNVLYFAMCESSFELFSKCIARRFWQTKFKMTNQYNVECCYPTPSSLDIRAGIASKNYPQELEQQQSAYKNTVKNHMYIIENANQLQVETIQDLVKKFIEETQTRPVVIVDPLQLITPTLTNDQIPNTRNNIEHIVRYLKAMQIELNIPVIVVSALNKRDYQTYIQIEDFNGFGNIKDAVDVIWGLQLSIFERTGTIEHPYKTCQAMKYEAENPRRVSLICIKNKYGTNYKCHFQYYTASDCFVKLKPSC